MNTVHLKLDYRGVEIVLKKGNIAEEDVEAIVNPANSLMVMGGGVAGALKKLGGSVIEREALKYAPVPVGRAVATSAGRLKARYVIHAPTMEKPAQRTTVESVRKAAEAVAETLSRLSIRTVAFPGMGTGVGGLPVYESVKTVAETLRKAIDSGLKLEKAVFVAYSDRDLEGFRKALTEVFG